MISRGRPLEINPTRNLANLVKDKKFYISYGLIRQSYLTETPSLVCFSRFLLAQSAAV